MADYLYMLETRLSPEQQRAVALVQETARAHEMNVYLTGGTMRDIISGYSIRDLDFTVQGNPFKLQKDLERAGALPEAADEDCRSLFLRLPGNIRSEINMARQERYDKPGKPEILPGTIIEDLRRRDFTANAMALSLNEGSRGLLLDPANGAADIEAKLIRILHNYSFYEDPSRLIRAIRFSTRFHWAMEERTRARYDAAVENDYIKHIPARAIGLEIEQIAHEDDPLHVMAALEKEGWLKILHSRWSTSKVDTTGLKQLMRTRAQMQELGYSPDVAPAAAYFLTRRLGSADVAQMQRQIPHKEFVNIWRRLDVEAKALADRLKSKEGATPSRAWQVLSEAKPEAILFLEATTRQQAVAQKIRNFLGKWRQIQQRLPLPEMLELRITPDLPQYPQLAEEVFRLMLDGKLRTHTELVKFLKPHAPPPPAPPPAPPKRGRKKAGAAEPTVVPGPAKRGRKPKAEDESKTPAVAATPLPAKRKPSQAVSGAKKKAPPKKAAARGKAPKKKSAQKKLAKKKAAKKKPAKKKPTRSKARRR